MELTHDRLGFDDVSDWLYYLDTAKYIYIIIHISILTRICEW